jgi:putative acetyltransferase
VAIRLLQPGSPGEWLRARRLVEEYAASLERDLSFQDLSHELDHLESEYAPPEGAFFVALDGDVALGCGGLRCHTPGVGEVKRLYVAPAARGRGVGRLLAQAVVDAGRQLGYARLLLDTWPSMTEAQALYASLGFVPTDAYRFNPVPGTVYLQLSLR